MNVQERPNPSNPPGLHDPTRFGYSHSVAVPAGAELVFVSGQYASGRDGAVVSDDFGAQVARTFANVATALAAHGLDLRDVVQLRTYVVGVDGDALGALAGFIGETWGAAPPTQTLVGVASLAMPQIRVEIEAVALRG